MYLNSFENFNLQSALEHRKARHAALCRMAELQESEETFKLRRLECEKETWEVERGLQVHIKTRSLCMVRVRGPQVLQALTRDY